MNQDIYRLRETKVSEQTKVPSVIVVDFDMPFLSMVNFMMKWMFASLLAAIAVGIILVVPLVLLAGLAWILVP